MAKRSYARMLLDGFTIQITSTIQDSLYCSLCSNVLCEPQQTTCGCRFCLECINKYLLSDTKKCPGDTIECDTINIHEDVRPDAVAKRQIKKLVAKCPFELCDIEEEVSKIQIHMRACGENIRQCDEERKEECNSEEHREEEEEKCSFCEKEFSRLSMDTFHYNFDHADVCDKYLDYCPNKCGEIEKVVWRDHARICTADTFPCPYEKLGCDSKLRKTEINEHLAEDAYKHTEVLLKQIDNLNNELTTMKKEQKTKDQEIKDEIANIKALINTSKILQTLNIGQIESRCSSIEDKQTFYNGVFLWKLRNYELNFSGSQLSPSFYANDGGYRMQLEITTNDTNGFLSIFVKLGPGQNDDDLDWPFDRKVTIRILDQEQRNRNFVRTVDFWDGPRKKTKKPHRRYFNEGYGSPQFISIYDLQSKSYLYSVETLWIDCFVD